MNLKVNGLVHIDSYRLYRKASYEYQRKLWKGSISKQRQVLGMEMWGQNIVSLEHFQVHVVLIY